MSDHEALGVPKGSSEAALTSAYRRLAKQLHPDAHPEASDAERQARAGAMVRLNLAYAAARRAARRASQSAEPERDHLAELSHGAEREALPIENGPEEIGADQVEPSRPSRPRARVKRTIAALTAVSALAVVLVNRPTSTSPTPVVGSCVAWSGIYSATPCRTIHAGLVVSTAPAAAACAPRMSFMRDDDHYLCIDLTR